MHGKHCAHCPCKNMEPVPEIQPTALCIERFATAKKFHAENLQHQPLPDCVDDAVFSVNINAKDPYMCDVVKRCQRIVPRRNAGRKKESIRPPRYVPALGCKRPTTYMDLAICWETPLDPIYEPRRTVHIDGSDGGPAPAVFTLVQHPAPQVDVREGSIPGRNQDVVDDRKDAECCRHCCECPKKRTTTDTEDKELCKGLNSMRITGEKSGGPKTKRIHFLRHCAGCEHPEKSKSPTRVTRSAACTRKPTKTNGLPSRLQVPRPRTPYARRSFCIDSLTPPFSVVAGCRDTDYPENWRLTSVYRQSYRNPKKMREGRTLLKYDRFI